MTLTERGVIDKERIMDFKTSLNREIGDSTSRVILKKKNLFTCCFLDILAANGNKKTEEDKRNSELPGSAAKSAVKKKRNRSHFTQGQLKYLEDVFTRQQYLTRDERAMLATVLNMTELQIRNWFQNRRYQLRHRGLNRAKQVPVKVLVSSSTGQDSDDRSMWCARCLHVVFTGSWFWRLQLCSNQIMWRQPFSLLAIGLKTKDCIALLNNLCKSYLLLESKSDLIKLTKCRSRPR